MDSPHIQYEHRTHGLVTHTCRERGQESMARRALPIV